MNTLLRPRNITQTDLEWWFGIAPTLTWTFAKTYADTAPHSYVVDGKTQGLTRRDYIRAAAVIRSFGQPAKYYAMTNIYLTSPDGLLKWWSMDKRIPDTNLINQASTDRTYGEQDAPSTLSRSQSVYDEIATDYDELRSPVDGDSKTGLLAVLAKLQGCGAIPANPTVLDVGCGTGAVLDLGVTTADRYTGVDPSQPMLNELLMKYNREQFAGITPARIENALTNLKGHQFDLVIAAFGSASYVSREALQALRSHAGGAMVLMAYPDNYRPSYHRASTMVSPDEPPRLSELARSWGTSLACIGKFETLVLTNR